MISLNALSGQDTWVEEPGLRNGRSSHGCGLIKGENGTEIVVVGGGYAWDDVEIFNINTREWRSGNNMAIKELNEHEIGNLSKFAL